MDFLNNVGKKAADKAYELVSKVDGGRDYYATATHHVSALFKQKNPRIYLKPGNVVQFIGRDSARAIQIVVEPSSKELVCNAVGGIGPFYPNAYWLVVCAQNGHFYFHNNYNYLAIKNSKIVIIPSTINEKPPMEAEFIVHDVFRSSNAVYLESVTMPGYYLCFDEDGQPVENIKLKSKETCAQFDIQLITYGPGVVPEKDDRNVEQSDELQPPSYWSATSASSDESKAKLPPS